MTSRDFCYWLQGFFEIVENSDKEEVKEVKITKQQAKVIRAHLNLVFKHEIDPETLRGKTKKEIEEYVAVHRGAKDQDTVTEEDKKEAKDLIEKASTLEDEIQEILLKYGKKFPEGTDILEDLEDIDLLEQLDKGILDITKEEVFCAETDPSKIALNC